MPEVSYSPDIFQLALHTHVQTCIKGIQKSKGSIHVQLCDNFLYTLLFKMLHMLYTELSLVMLLEICSIQ